MYKLHDIIGKAVPTSNDEEYIVYYTYGDYSLIQRNTKFQPWVVTWLLNYEGKYWEQGFYFEDFVDAFLFMVTKADENRILSAAIDILNKRDLSYLAEEIVQEAMRDDN